MYFAVFSFTLASARQKSSVNTVIAETEQNPELLSSKPKVKNCGQVSNDTLCLGNSQILLHGCLESRVEKGSEAPVGKGKQCHCASLEKKVCSYV
jgi:hypothetical protein